MAGDRPRPIFSSLCEDPANQEAIDAFVVALAARVDDLQDLEARCELPRLGELAETLRVDSDRVGFDLLSRCAASVCASAREGRPEDARKALVDLTEVAHRIRLGHRGAV
jgi:hypothetical protein